MPLARRLCLRIARQHRCIVGINETAMFRGTLAKKLAWHGSFRLAFITCGLPKASSCSSRLDLAKVTSAPNRSYSLHERSNSWKEKQPAQRSGDWERKWFPHSFLLVFLLNSKLRMDQLRSAS